MAKAETTHVYVKPRDGARIIQPNRNHRVMPAEGDFVDMNDVFYVRLLGWGDIVRADPPAEPKAAKPTKPATSDDK
jgi:hypothetical protein